MQKYQEESKGSTINHLGGQRKNRKCIYFFCGNVFLELLFFPGEGTPKFFFLDFLQALPQIINPI